MNLTKSARYSIRKKPVIPAKAGMTGKRTQARGFILDDLNGSELKIRERREKMAGAREKLGRELPFSGSIAEPRRVKACRFLSALPAAVSARHVSPPEETMPSSGNGSLRLLIPLISAGHFSGSQRYFQNAPKAIRHVMHSCRSSIA